MVAFANFDPFPYLYVKKNYIYIIFIFFSSASVHTIAGKLIHLLKI